MLIVMELCYRLRKMVIQSRQGKPSCKCWANDKGAREGVGTCHGPGRRLSLDGEGLRPGPLEQWGRVSRLQGESSRNKGGGWGNVSDVFKGP